ncbi:UNKNOWN [Stylonychia lemnae]|uniref:Uncharacterized protein n=1 Tax=Stylonychia lemnae TaxID=5949 RepID=A0A078AU02_STYLE|nr:UNKNOWN [Stylonychia lemnae]|eukprot:CDW84323.1 UNKNOWN [Stylonychia lemnae]
MIIQSQSEKGNHYESLENAERNCGIQRQSDELDTDSFLRASNIKLQTEEQPRNIESDKKKMGLTYDESLLAAGGFGRFQWFTTIFITILFNSSGHLFYGLAYLELYPAYICPQDIPNCDHTDKCRDPSIPIDWSSDKSLHNWVEKLDLTCAEPYKVGLLGSMYFAGWTIACLVVPRIGWYILCLLARNGTLKICQYNICVCLQFRWFYSHLDFTLLQIFDQRMALPSNIWNYNDCNFKCFYAFNA